MKTPPASVKRNAKKSRRDRLEEGGSSSSRRMDQDAASDSDTSDQGEQVFIVEEIINHRYNKRRLRMEYHVKWSGYPSSDNSWEPSESFMATGILEAYQDEHFDSFPRSVQRQLGSSLNRSRGQQKPPSKKRRRSSSEESARFQKDSDTSSEIDDRPPLDSTEEDHADTTTTTTAYTEEVIEEGSCHHFGPGIEVEKGVFLPAVPENRIEELEDEAMPESTIRDETRNERLSSKVATSSTAVPDNVNDKKTKPAELGAENPDVQKFAHQILQLDSWDPYVERVQTITQDADPTNGDQLQVHIIWKDNTFMSQGDSIKRSAIPLSLAREKCCRALVDFMIPKISFKKTTSQG